MFEGRYFIWIELEVPNDNVIGVVIAYNVGPIQTESVSVFVGSPVNYKEDVFSEDALRIGAGRVIFGTHYYELGSIS